jgi:hypothetical protein
MKVSEIKAIAPLADVYELKDGARYIIVVDPSEPRHVFDALQAAGHHSKIQGVIVAAHRPIQFYEIGE